MRLGRQQLSSVFFFLGLGMWAGCVREGEVKDEAARVSLRPVTASYGKGRVVRSGSRRYHSSNQYDRVGRIINTQHTMEGVSYRYSFEYGYVGGAALSGEYGNRLVATLYPDGERLESFVDAVGTSQKVISSLTEADSSVVYKDVLSGRSRINRLGQAEWHELGNGTRTYYSYDSFRRLSNVVTVRMQDNVTLQAFGYHYDSLGRIQRVDDFCTWASGAPSCCDPRDSSCEKQEMSAQYSYDISGYLKTAVMNGVTQTFEANAIGNLTKKDGTLLEYGDVLHAHAATVARNVSGQTTGNYEYNAVGSMLRMEEEGVVTEMKWNALEMPVETRRGADVTQRFYLGEHLYKRHDVVNGVATTTWFLPGLRIEGATYRKHYGFAERESQPSEGDIQARAGTLRFFHANHLGSSTLVTDSSGVPVHRAVYAPFGEEIQKTGTYTPKQEFGGKEKEAVSGLYDFGARLYHPKLGRFVSADSVMDGLNRYSYVHNNPINLVDPSGHFAQDPKGCERDSKGCTTSQEPELGSDTHDYDYALIDPKFAGARIASTPKGQQRLSEWLDVPLMLFSMGQGWIGATAGVLDAYRTGDNIYVAAALGTLGPVERGLKIGLKATRLDKIVIPFIIRNLDGLAEQAAKGRKRLFVEISAQIEKVSGKVVPDLWTASSPTIRVYINSAQERISLNLGIIKWEDGSESVHRYVNWGDDMIIFGDNLYYHSTGRVQSSMGHIFEGHVLDVDKAKSQFKTDDVEEIYRMISETIQQNNIIKKNDTHLDFVGKFSEQVGKGSKHYGVQVGVENVGGVWVVKTAFPVKKFYPPKN